MVLHHFPSPSPLLGIAKVEEQTHRRESVVEEKVEEKMGRAISEVVDDIAVSSFLLLGPIRYDVL